MKKIIGHTSAFILGAAIITLTHQGCGCSAVKTGCSIVDLAHQACVSVEFLDANGNKQRVQFTKEELTQMSRAKLVRDKGGQDGGSR